ncbi:MAG: saccharopine dehydrogenase family protein [Promethearchaeota archaeon]
MKVLILGSGLMGRGAAYYLAHTESVEQFIVADINEKAAEGLSKEFGDKSVAEKADARNKKDLESLFTRVDTVVSAISYTLNELHTEIAIETGTNMVDLGGNIFVHEKQFAMRDAAKDAGITVIPDMGLAPGMTNILARAGIDQLSTIDSVRLRVGGLQQDPRPPLNYSLIFSVEGLINEYVEPCRVLRDGKIVMEDPLVGVEELEFPEPFGKLEAFNTSGGTSTLPLTYEGKIANLDYKTIRYPGHGHKMWCIYRLGLMDSSEIEIDGVNVAPRRVLERLLEENLPPTGKDVTLVRCTIEGWEGKEPRTIQYQLIDYFDDLTKLTSMMRTTSFPAAAVAVMCADGTITERGVLAPEVAIPPQVFIEEMRNRGIDIEESVF